MNNHLAVGLVLKAGSDRRLLELFLKEQGYGVVVGETEDVLRTWKNLGLILVDIWGLERTAQAIRDLKFGRYLLPVILVARSDARGIGRYLEQGLCDDVLRMPVSKPELASRLRVLLRLSQRSRQNLLKFETLFEDASWGVAVMDPQSLEIQAVNSAFAQMHGLSQEELLHRPFAELATPSAKEVCSKHLKTLLREGSHTFETEHSHRLGRPVQVEIDATLYRDDAGAPLYVAAYVRDISIRKRTEAELALRNQELVEAGRLAEAASRVKSDFLANISHEIRTPLHGILATLSLLARSPLTEEQSEYARLMKGSSMALLTLVNDILDFSTLESGEFLIRLVPVAFQVLLESLVEQFQPIAQGKGVELTLRTENLPNLLLADPIRIRQVLRNLLSNALKFTDRGSVVLVGAWDAARKVLCLSVTDTGIGIGSEQQQRIFDVFHQEDNSTTRRYGGTGLGLTICQRLLELMGGSLKVESTKELGSKFSFELPLSLAPLSEEKPSPLLHEKALRVLLVEDEPINQRVMTLMLSQLGHEVEVATDGAEGVEKYERDNFDLILMDLQMPRLGGIDAARQIREVERIYRRSRTPIIAITARAQPGDPENCIRAGIDDYYTKPLWLERLKELLRNIT